MGYKILMLAFALLLLYYRPVYGVFMFLLFNLEYYHFFRMFFLVKTNKTYCKISISLPYLSDLSNVAIWFTWCEINAFSRLYFFLKKKNKINAIQLIIQLLLISFVYIFNIPLKLLKLCYRFVFRKGSFRTALINVTLDSYALVKNSKIEVLNGKVYLNCSNFYKLTKYLLNENLLIDPKLFEEGVKKLAKITKEYSIKEERYGRCEVGQQIVQDERGRVLSKVPHYTLIEGGVSIHATSNVGFNLLDNQRVDGIIVSLLKKGAIWPGTVITKGVSTKKIIAGKTILVPNAQIDVIRVNHQEFTVDSNVKNYQIEKEERFEEILAIFFKLENRANSELLNGFRYNEFTGDLENVGDTEIKNTYKQVFREIVSERGDRGDF